MTTYTWPAEFVPGQAEMRVIDNLQRYSESPLSGYVQTLAMPGARWGWQFDFSAQRMDQRMRLEGFLQRLNGMQHRVRLWDLKHPRPRGTVALSGISVNASVAQFATSLVMLGGATGATLLAGDWFATATQLFRCVADTSFDGSNLATVEFWPPTRAAIAPAAAITLDKPTALFVRTEAGIALPPRPGQAAEAFSVGFMEVFA